MNLNGGEKDSSGYGHVQANLSGNTYPNQIHSPLSSSPRKQFIPPSLSRISRFLRKNPERLLPVNMLGYLSVRDTPSTSTLYLVQRDNQSPKLKVELLAIFLV